MLFQLYKYSCKLGSLKLPRRSCWYIKSSKCNLGSSDKVQLICIQIRLCTCISIKGNICILARLWFWIMQLSCNMGGAPKHSKAAHCSLLSWIERRLLMACLGYDQRLELESSHMFFFGLFGWIKWMLVDLLLHVTFSKRLPNQGAKPAVI